METSKEALEREKQKGSRGANHEPYYAPLV